MSQIRRKRSSCSTASSRNVCCCALIVRVWHFSRISRIRFWFSLVDEKLKANVIRHWFQQRSKFSTKQNKTIFILKIELNTMQDLLTSSPILALLLEEVVMCTLKPRRVLEALQIKRHMTKQKEFAHKKCCWCLLEAKWKTGLCP